MKRGIVYCKALKLDVNKSERCPDYTCDQCPEISPIKSSSQDKNRKIPNSNQLRGFADLYIKGKISLPVLHNISDFIKLGTSKNRGFLESTINRWETRAQMEVLELKQNKLNTLNRLKLPIELENKIYVALYELVQARNALLKPALRDLNRKIVKKRKDTEKALEKALKYPFLSESTKEAVKKELDRLKKFDKEKGEYHPIKEVKYYREVLEPTTLTGLLGGPVSYRLHNETLEKFLSTPYKIKEGRPPKFFYKALQVIVFKYLNEQHNILTEKAKKLSAEIINEYLNKQGYPDMANLTSKDIDNALHSS